MTAPAELARAVNRLADEVAELRVAVAALRPGPKTAADLLDGLPSFPPDDPYFAEITRSGREWRETFDQELEDDSEPNSGADAATKSNDLPPPRGGGRCAR